MSRFLCKFIVYRTSHLGLLRNPNVCSLRWFSSGGSDQEHSFAVSYLIDSLGLSPNQALSASKRVTFETREKPDKVIKAFEDYGFSKSQISTLVRRYSEILSSNEKTILPKMEFLKAKGISGPEMGKVLCFNPRILTTSLENTIIPSYDFYRNLFQSDEKVIAAVKRYPSILRGNYKYILPDIDILHEYGVPNSNITKLLLNQPRTFISNSSNFRRVVEKVAEMGFPASQFNFVLAVHVSLAISKSTWQSKVNSYKKWGLSEEDVLRAFRKYPMCMAFSEGKTTTCIDYIVNKLGWKPYIVVERPVILGLSLKKRIIPRCSVFQVLVSKGLVENKVNISALLLSSEQKFLEKYVMPYENEDLELLKLYKKQLSL